jgi:nitrogen PTS system EIIA component
MPEHEILTIEEVAQYLRVSERTVYEWAQRGEIPCGKIGTSWRFKRTEVERWVDSRLAQKRQHVNPPAVSIAQMLPPERVVRLEHAAKREALEQMLDVMATAPEVRNRDDLAEAIFHREELMSTGIGFGVAVPHARIATVTDIVMGVGVSDGPIEDYESVDGQPVRIIVMVAAELNQHAQYLKALGAVSAKLKNEKTRTLILEAGDTATVHEQLTQ